MPVPTPKVKQTAMFLPQPMVPGTLIKRYKRFLADVELQSGEIITAHCANPGAMTGLNMPGLPVYLSKSDNPKRKLAWSLEFVELPTGLVGINTNAPNKIVGEALAKKSISELAAYSNHRPEVRYGENSRIDFLLSEPGLPDCYLEIKNVHLCRQAGHAEFPDSKTARGAKHLGELAKMVANGHRAINLYVVQRPDCKTFALARDIDPTYAEAFDKARQSGVEILCYTCAISLDKINLANTLPILER